MTKLTAPAHGLSLQFVTAEAREIDWREASGLGVDGYLTILPLPTYGEVEEHASDLVEQWREEAESLAEGFLDDRSAVAGQRACPADEHISRDQLDEFTSADRYYEWADGFEPMMNYAWPVSLAYGMVDLDAVTAAIAEFAPNCTLVELSDDVKRATFGDGSDSPDYAIALNGGGMDLSDNIVAAYLCCGCVPPIQLLERQAGVMGEGRRDAIREVLDQAYTQAIDWLMHRAKRLSDECSRLMKA